MLCLLFMYFEDSERNRLKYPRSCILLCHIIGESCSSDKTVGIVALFELQVIFYSVLIHLVIFSRLHSLAVVES